MKFELRKANCPKFSQPVIVDSMGDLKAIVYLWGGQDLVVSFNKKPVGFDGTITIYNDFIKPLE